MGNEEKGKGISFVSILTLVFVIAKILGYLKWSWWLVFMPIIISLGLSILIIIVAVVWSRR